MFVDIENFKSALAVENILTPYKKGRLSQDKKSRLPKEPITPDICMEILKSTNYARNIKDMLECIKELPPHEQAQFKDVVLACFDNREQPNDILVLGKKLAVASCFEAELSEAQKLKDGEFLHSSSNLDKAFVSLKDSFEDVDFSAYDKVICLSDKEIQFLEGVKFPKHLGIPNSSDVSFASYFRRNANFLASGSDFTGLQSMRFKDGAKVELREVKNLSSDADFSQCDVVKLSGKILNDKSQLRFKEGAEVMFHWIEFHSAQLDVSMCSQIKFLFCDFKDMDCLIFKNLEQMKASEFQRPDKWKGKLIFTDEQQLLQAGKEIDMKKKVSAKVEDARHGADEKSSAHNRWADLSVNCLVKAADKLELAKSKFGRGEGRKCSSKREFLW